MTFLWMRIWRYKFIIKYLVYIHKFCELSPPENKSFFQTETNTLQQNGQTYKY